MSKIQYPILPILFVLMTLLSGALYFGRWMPPAGTTKIAVVNSARIKNESEPFVFAKKDAERFGQEIGDWLDKRKEKLQTLATLVKDNTISTKKRAIYKSQYEQEYSKIGEELRSRKEMLQKRFDKLSTMLTETVMEVTRQLASKHGLSMVLNTQVGETMTVYCASKSVDLTDEAIDMLNKKLRNISELLPN
jgi:Skp family chaperone for outer membrane proteins